LFFFWKTGAEWRFFSTAVLGEGEKKGGFVGGAAVLGDSVEILSSSLQRGPGISEDSVLFRPHSMQSSSVRSLNHRKKKKLPAFV
jgi:hypothetical protein